MFIVSNCNDILSVDLDMRCWIPTLKPEEMMNKEQSSTINKFDIVEIRIVSCRHQVQILLRWFDLSDQIWYQHLHRNRPDNQKSSRTNCSGSIRVQEICASGISVLIGLIDRWWNWTSLFNQERMNVCECKYSTCTGKNLLQHKMKLNLQSQELIELYTFHC